MRGQEAQQYLIDNESKCPASDLKKDKERGALDGF